MGRKKINRVGEKKTNNFGSEIKITEYNNANDIIVVFPEYNWQCKSAYKEFKKGSIRCPYEPRIHGIGYLGEGPYKPHIGRKHTKVYEVWSNMISRCYNNEFWIEHPTYKDCVVCKEWHNFQNFAKWYEENYYEIPNMKMHIDKDILIKNNKIYSPKTCIIVPNDINTLFVKCDTNRGDLPIGVFYDKRIKKYGAQCQFNKEHKHLGYYNTSEEAFNAYKTFKEDYIKQVADQYRELIPKKLYNALYEYEVEWED